MFDTKDIDKDKLIQSILNPLGGLNLSDSERKLLFFRHVGAEYAMSARKNRVPYASNITRAGTSFGSLGGGSDPMMMLMLSGALNNNQKDDNPPNNPPTDIEVVCDAVDKLIQRVDKISKKVGVGA